MLLLVLSLGTLLASFSDLIARGSSSLGASLASSSAPSDSSSAFCAHSVRGVAASWAFSRNVSLSSILASATCLLPLSPLFFSSLMFSSLLLVVLVWVLWLLRVQWFRCF